MPHQGNTRWQLGIQHITQSEQKSTFKLGIFVNTKSGSRHRVSEHCEEPRLLAEKQNHNGLTPRGSAATGARKAPGWTPCLLIVMHIFIQKSTSKIVRVYGVKTKVRSFRNGFPVFESVQLDEWGYRGDQYVESD